MHRVTRISCNHHYRYNYFYNIFFITVIKNLQFLQPLMDNLESGTYEVFEKDPVKYREYQNAIHHALVDRVDIENVEKVQVVVMVLGAGRGPLVRATLRVSLHIWPELEHVRVRFFLSSPSLKFDFWGHHKNI